MRSVLNHLRQHTVGYVALFVALSGSAYAATALPLNSVGTAQVKNHSLLGVDFKSGQIPAGKRGAPGARGPAGTFDASKVSSVTGPLASLCPLGAGDCAVGVSAAQCPAGSVPISGGWVPQDGNPAVLATIVYNGPSGAGGWGVMIVNNSDTLSGGFQAVAVCGAGGVTPLARRTPADLGALRRSVVERLRTG